MESILYELWQGRVHPQERKNLYDREQKELIELMDRHRAKLLESLNEEQNELFEKYTDCAAELSCLMEEELFLYAFRLGGTIVAETLIQ